MASEINTPERPRRDKLGTSSRQVGSNDPPAPPRSRNRHQALPSTSWFLQATAPPHTPLEPHGKLCEMAAFPSFT